MCVLNVFFNLTSSYYYAVDTTVNPNIVYRIDYNINYTRINDLVRLW